MDAQYVNPVLLRNTQIVADHGKGSWLYDLNGDKYLDFTCGIAVNNIGHCHPRVVEAIQKQAAQLIHTSVTAHHKNYIELCKRLAEIAPGDLDSTFLSNSGAEAVEGAIKMARYVTGRHGIINFRGSFHGRTLLATALTTSKAHYRERYGPFPAGIYTAPYPYTYRSVHRGNPEACAQECLNFIQLIFDHQVPPDHVAAMLIEPVLGEGGYVVPPEGYLKRLRQIAAQHGILFIADEIQSGFGRTGKMFALEHFDVQPDVLLMAKGIAGGMPLSAFTASKNLTQHWKPGRHGTTFGGNPVSCAAALASLEVIEQEGLIERAAKVGQMMLNRLSEFAKEKPHIGEVRGLGLMIGIDFNDEGGAPGSKTAELVTRRCFENKLLVLTCGTYGHVIRLLPPLNITDSEIEQGLEILEKSMII